jgi:hypothetical protein
MRRYRFRALALIAAAGLAALVIALALAGTI